jgi:hypothetical protein
MRDATESWSGYLYQSIIGLIVFVEKVIELQSYNTEIIGELVYEDYEDFSIYLKDENETNIKSQTYQVKFKKSKKPSDYYPFFKNLIEKSSENKDLDYFLNISCDVNFNSVDFKKNNLPDNFIKKLYTYKNKQNYLGGVEAIDYLEILIKEYLNKKGVEPNNDKAERAVSSLISHIDKIILRTKDKRINEKYYREKISFKSLLHIIDNTSDEINFEVGGAVIKKRILSSYYIFCESLNEEEIVNLEKFATYISEINNEELISFTKKLEIHKDLSTAIEFLSAFKNPEDIQDILFESIKSIKKPLDMNKLIFKEKNTAYRPSSIRISTNQMTAKSNLKIKYIPLIEKNMSLYDVEAYFNTKKIIISGNTIDNIWEYKITSSHQEKKENKINEPELKSLISVKDAIKEINRDD